MTIYKYTLDGKLLGEVSSENINVKRAAKGFGASPNNPHYYRDNFYHTLKLGRVEILTLANRRI